MPENRTSMAFRKDYTHPTNGATYPDAYGVLEQVFMNLRESWLVLQVYFYASQEAAAQGKDPLGPPRTHQVPPAVFDSAFRPRAKDLAEEYILALPEYADAVPVA